VTCSYRRVSPLAHLLSQNEDVRHAGFRLGLVSLLLAVTALVAAARALFLVVYMAIAFRFDVDPISQPLSMYVFVEGGGEAFDSAALTLAAAMIALLLGMIRAGVRVRGAPAAYFSLWAGCLVLATLFPTDRSPSIETLAGWVHQIAGGGILALLALGGFALLPRLSERPEWRRTVSVVKALSAWTAALAITYVVSRLNDWFPDFFSWTLGFDPGGILQRLALTVDAAVIGALAIHLIRLNWPALRNSGEHGPDTAAAPH
jgi:hypothetical protein